METLPVPCVEAALSNGEAETWILAHLLLAGAHSCAGSSPGCLGVHPTDCSAGGEEAALGPTVGASG